MLVQASLYSVTICEGPHMLHVPISMTNFVGVVISRLVGHDDFGAKVRQVYEGPLRVSNDRHCRESQTGDESLQVALRAKMKSFCGHSRYTITLPIAAVGAYFCLSSA